MEDNENKGVEEEVQDAPTEQEAALETEESEGAPDSQEGTVDYEAELKKEQEKTKNYKEGMLIAKKKLKEKSSVDPEEIAKMVGDIVAKELGSIKGVLNQNNFETSLTSLTSNPAKQNLVRFHYENSIVKTGDDPQSIKNDLENALLIADKKSLLNNMKELAVSAKNRSQVANSGMGGGSKPDTSKKFFSDEQIANLKKKGFTDKMIEDLKRNVIKKKEA